MVVAVTVTVVVAVTLTVTDTLQDITICYSSSFTAIMHFGQVGQPRYCGR